MKRVYKGLKGENAGFNECQCCKRKISKRYMNDNRSVLIVVSVASMVDQFLMPNVRLLLDMGYNVDIATNFVHGSTCSDEQIWKLLNVLDALFVDCYHIDFSRDMADLSSHIKSVRQLNSVVKGNAKPLNQTKHHIIDSDHTYNLIHSHSPMGGVIGRYIARKHRIRSFYTAHGFHFYKGAPVKNWLLYYTIESIFSNITDVLITINTEDYLRARTSLHAEKVAYIPGVGVDIEKYRDIKIDRNAKRAELGIRPEDTMLFSAGELNRNKNHRIVIEAISMLEKRDDVHYFIAGKGDLYGELISLAERKNVNLHLMGFRDDVPELLKASDIFLLPSMREGLNVGLMEAMASGLPCLVSDIRGSRDLIDSRGGWLATPGSVRDFYFKLKEALRKKNRHEMGAYNGQKVKSFSKEEVTRRLKLIYEEKRYGLEEG